MHDFTKLSNKLRLKMRNALFKSPHHTFLYRLQILKGKAREPHTIIVSTAIQSYIRNVPRVGITVLNFLYITFFNGKLPFIYKLAPTGSYLPSIWIVRPMHIRSNPIRSLHQTYYQHTQPANLPTKPLEPRLKAVANHTPHMASGLY